MDKYLAVDQNDPTSTPSQGVKRSQPSGLIRPTIDPNQGTIDNILLRLRLRPRSANRVRIPGSARIFLLFSSELQIGEIDRVRLIGIILFKSVSVHNKFPTNLNFF